MSKKVKNKTPKKVTSVSYEFVWPCYVKTTTRYRHDDRVVEITREFDVNNAAHVMARCTYLMREQESDLLNRIDFLRTELKSLREVIDRSRVLKFLFGGE